MAWEVRREAATIYDDCIISLRERTHDDRTEGRVDLKYLVRTSYYRNPNEPTSRLYERTEFQTDDKGDAIKRYEEELFRTEAAEDTTHPDFTL